MSYVCQLSKD